MKFKVLLPNAKTSIRCVSYPFLHSYYFSGSVNSVQPSDILKQWPRVTSAMAFKERVDITINENSDARSEDDDITFAGMSLNVLAQVASHRLEIDKKFSDKKKKVI